MFIAAHNYLHITGTPGLELRFYWRFFRLSVEGGGVAVVERLVGEDTLLLFSRRFLLSCRREKCVGLLL